MYYSSGNYEAFARPKKPADVDNKHAYIIGTGLAALSAACYLVRDGQMPGENIHILEKDPVPGGACDGLDIPGLGYVMRGGREMARFPPSKPKASAYSTSTTGSTRRTRTTRCAAPPRISARTRGSRASSGCPTRLRWKS